MIKGVLKMKIICIEKSGNYGIKTITTKRELLALRIDQSIKIIALDGSL